MPDTLYGFEVQDDNKDSTAKEMYSRNKLINGDFEFGADVNWHGVSYRDVPGGIDGSKLAAEVDPKIGYAEQKVQLGGAQAPDYVFKGLFLPKDVITDVETSVKFFVKVVATYAVGDANTHYIPVVEPLAYKPAEDGTEVEEGRWTPWRT